jgi:hypothetical protein
MDVFAASSRIPVSGVVANAAQSQVATALSQRETPRSPTYNSELPAPANLASTGPWRLANAAEVLRISEATVTAAARLRPAVVERDVARVERDVARVERDVATHDAPEPQPVAQTKAAVQPAPAPRLAWVTATEAPPATATVSVLV